jgi:hypothetical protein
MPSTELVETIGLYEELLCDCLDNHLTVEGHFPTQLESFMEGVDLCAWWLCVHVCTCAVALGHSNIVRFW